jgi:hypothetical protein
MAWTRKSVNQRAWLVHVFQVDPLEIGVADLG